MALVQYLNGQLIRFSVTVQVQTPRVTTKVCSHSNSESNHISVSAFVPYRTDRCRSSRHSDSHTNSVASSSHANALAVDVDRAVWDSSISKATPSKLRRRRAPQRQRVRRVARARRPHGRHLAPVDRLDGCQRHHRHHRPARRRHRGQRRPPQRGRPSHLQGTARAGADPTCHRSGRISRRD